MTGNEALAEVLARVGASHDGTVLIAGTELEGWPPATVATLKAKGILAEAAPAGGVECNGCHQRCFMTVIVRTAPGVASRASITCDKRDDINLVEVPLGALEQWQASGEAIATALARHLQIPRLANAGGHARRWEIGAFGGPKRSAHLVLEADGELRLKLAGHTLALADVVTLAGKTLRVAIGMLTECVEKPAVDGAGLITPQARREMLAQRVAHYQQEGRSDYTAAAAEEAGMSARRLRQILQPRKSKPSGTRESGH